jgi:hypothetical protein
MLITLLTAPLLLLCACAAGVYGCASMGAAEDAALLAAAVSGDVAAAHAALNAGADKHCKSKDSVRRGARHCKRKTRCCAAARTPRRARGAARGGDAGGRRVRVTGDTALRRRAVTATRGAPQKAFGAPPPAAAPAAA